MKNAMIIFGLLAVLTLTACGQKGDQGDTGIQGPPGEDAPVIVPTPPVVDEIQEEIDALLQDENDYRLGLGQTMLSEGLSCTVQEIASGQRISSSSPAGLGAVIAMTGTQYSYLYKGLFNQPDAASGGSNLIPASIRPLFIGKNYLVRCQGQIVVLDTDYYQFTLNSDDGSLLYIDGATVINNDGNHGMTLVSGTKFLRRGVHTFRVDYAQTGGGNFGLVLQANGASIEGRFYAH